MSRQRGTLIAAGSRVTKTIKTGKPYIFNPGKIRKIHFTGDFSLSKYAKCQCGLIERAPASLTSKWDDVTCLNCQRLRPLETIRK